MREPVLLKARCRGRFPTGRLEKRTFIARVLTHSVPWSAALVDLIEFLQDFLLSRAPGARKRSPHDRLPDRRVRPTFGLLIGVDHFRNHRQLRWWHREAGGQLFARFALPDIVIEKATGPRRSDWRTRYSYRPNRRAEQREIRAHHAQGLHFVGDWHSHPSRFHDPRRAISVVCRRCSPVPPMR